MDLLDKLRWFQTQELRTELRRACADAERLQDVLIDECICPPGQHCPTRDFRQCWACWEQWRWEQTFKDSCAAGRMPG